MTPIFQRMLQPEAALEALEQATPVSAHTGVYRLGSLEFLDAKLREAWSIQYSAGAIELRSGRQLKRLVVAQHFPGGGLSRASSRLARQLERCRHDDPDLAALCGRHDSLRLLWSPFPLDFRLRWLWQAVTPALAQEKLQNLSLPGVAKARPCEIEVLRYVPARRCQIQYLLPGEDGTPVVLLGKTFRDDRGVELGRVMSLLAEAFSDGGDPHLSTPAPSGYLPCWRMLLQPHVGGGTLHRVLRQGAASQRHMKAAARCAALVHTSNIHLWSSHDVEDELCLAETAHRRLAAVGIAGGGFRQALVELTALAQFLDQRRLVPVHRDFYDRQLLVDGQRTTLIDLDTVTMGHPEIDLANFVAHLYLRDLQRPLGKAEQWTQAFLNAYSQAASVAVDTELLRFFLTSAFFRLACLYSTRLGGPDIARTLLDFSRLSAARGTIS